MKGFGAPPTELLEALEEAIGRAENGRDNKKDKPLPEAIVARLREAQERWTSSKVPFEVGDLVTPRSDAPLKNIGDPHLVIAVDHNARPDFSSGGEPGSFSYGRLNQIRVLSVLGDKKSDLLAAFWNEAAFYERYDGPT